MRSDFGGPVEPQETAGAPQHHFVQATPGANQRKPVVELSDETLVESELFDKPRTAMVQYRDKLLDQARQDDNGLTSAQRVSAQDTIRRMNRAIAERDERDRRSRERGRPEGCWCLGRGGQGQRGLGLGSPLDMSDLHPTMRVDSFIPPGQDTAPIVARHYCPCDEGQERKRRDEALRDGWMKGWRARSSADDLMRRWNESGLPAPALVRPLADYPVDTPERKATIAAVRSWTLPTWIYLQGEVQLGKTTILMGLARKALEEGRTVRFIEFAALMDHLRGGFDRRESQEDLLRPYKECDFLFLDDIGTGEASLFTLRQLFTILEHRKQHNLPVGFTSNRPLQDKTDPEERRRVKSPLTLVAVLLGRREGPTVAHENAEDGDMELADRTEYVGRIVARLMLMCHVVHVKGQALYPQDSHEPALHW